MWKGALSIKVEAGGGGGILCNGARKKLDDEGRRGKTREGPQGKYDLNHRGHRRKTQMQGQEEGKRGGLKREV